MSQEVKKNNNEKSSTWNIKPFLAMGLTALIVIMISVSFFFFVYRYQGASEMLVLIMDVLQPIMFGIIIAYLLNPLVNKIRGLLDKKTKLSGKTKRALSITGAMLVAAFVLFLFCLAVVPKVYSSIEELIISMPQMINDTATWIDAWWKNNRYLSTYFGEIIPFVTAHVERFIETQVLPQAQVLIAEVTARIFSMAKGVFNLIIGIIVSVYVLAEKEHFIATGKKLVFGLLPRKAGSVVLNTARKGHEVLSGFVIGKVIDSAIIGVLTFIILTIVNMPSALLVSVIVGATNIIPFFGPFIGAIPSFLLILIQDPVKSLWFLVIILIIQQVDGNIIGPTILGDTTGLSSFWVITAILFGGGLYGVPGMILGVPVFAVIYYCLDEIAKHFLRKKGLPEETAAYENVKERNPETGELIFFTDKTVEIQETEEKNKN